MGGIEKRVLESCLISMSLSDNIIFNYCSGEAPWNADGCLTICTPSVEFAFRADCKGNWFFCIHKNDIFGVLLGVVDGFIRKGSGCFTQEHIHEIIEANCVKYSKRNGKMLTMRMKDAMNGVMDEGTTEYIMACDSMRRRLGRALACSQMFEVALYLGYRKTAERGEHKLWSDE